MMWRNKRDAGKSIRLQREGALLSAEGAFFQVTVSVRQLSERRLM
jgi:hypothetical protein